MEFIKLSGRKKIHEYRNSFQIKLRRIYKMLHAIHSEIIQKPVEDIKETVCL